MLEAQAPPLLEPAGGEWSRPFQGRLESKSRMGGGGEKDFTVVSPRNN